uniref:ATP synthase F0 subunit 8 n=1 Tax=Trinodes hirtus TaxID=442100 RepID=S4SUB0_9COLE|nr:ATP synthase F0 subunit 8 [Trinodes hirtus]
MPQMAPMNWTILLINFSIMLMTTSTLNFYFSSFNPQKPMKKKSSSNWKW